MKKTNKANERKERIYTKLQNRILKKLTEAKEFDNFDKPWINPVIEDANNPFSKTVYRGFNQLMLSFAIDENNYSVNRWLTFKQSTELGGTVKKGSKSEEVIFYSFIYKKDGKTIKLEQVKALMKKTGKNKIELGISSQAFIKFYNVFNVEQVENLPKELYEVKEKYFETQPIQRAEELFLSTGAKLKKVNSNTAFFSLKTDEINMPLISQFENQQDYYNVLFHETSHWTGGKSRLNRKFGVEFGDRDYAKEELVAELTTAFVNNSIGLTNGITRNISYLNSWFSAVKKDVSYFISACSLAQKSADYIFSFEEQSDLIKVA